MSFHLTCEFLKIDWVAGDATYLNCAARRDDGMYVAINLRLDNYLRNNDGEFEWFTGESPSDMEKGFTRSAVSVTWTLEEDDSIFVLNAQLRNERQEPQEARVVLTGRFENCDGKLVFIDAYGNPDFADED